MKVKLGSEQEVKTDVIQNTLNPRWKQNFDLMVYERSVEVRIKREIHGQAGANNPVFFLYLTTRSFAVL